MVIKKNKGARKNWEILDIVLKQQFFGCLIYYSTVHSCCLRNRKHAKGKGAGGKKDREGKERMSSELTS